MTGWADTHNYWCGHTKAVCALIEAKYGIFVYIILLTVDILYMHVFVVYAFFILYIILTFFKLYNTICM